MIPEKAAAVLIGYLFGNFMTAELVVRKLTGKSAALLGQTGNPGMANVMANLGFLPGLIVLAGDVLKTFFSCMIPWLLFRSSPGGLSCFYGGMGAVLGHNFPIRQKGGKGVSCTCAALILYMPFFGILSCLSGALAVILTRYLCVGAAVIPAVFTCFMFFRGQAEAGWISLFLTLLMLNRHAPALLSIPGGHCPKTDVIGAIRKKCRH